MSTYNESSTVIVGASAAGLAAAACLKRAGLPFVLLEQSTRVAEAWRNHYDRLHLHTAKALSGLPYFRFPREAPRYPSRDQVVAYLEAYAAHFDLQPQFGQRVASITSDGEGWLTQTGTQKIRSRQVVIASGYTRVPHVPRWPDQDRFAGSLLHSSQYKNGAAYKGKRVLVIGFGNSGGEIAIDLHERGARPTLAVRGAVNVVPRDLLGIPILGVGIVLSLLPPALADAVGAPLTSAAVGNITALGLRKLPYGPMTQIREHGRIPLLDIGTIALIRAGNIAVRGGVERFTETGVIFEGGAQEQFDVVVAATGYRPGLADFLAVAHEVCNEDGVPRSSGRELLPGLYVCGFYVAPTGMLREIGIEAKRIAAAIRARD